MAIRNIKHKFQVKLQIKQNKYIQFSYKLLKQRTLQ